VEEMLGPGRGAPAGDLPYTPRSRRVLTETGQAAAKALGHDQVGSAHILLALISEDHAALQVLYRLGVSADSVREEVALLLGIPQIPAFTVPAADTAPTPTAPTPASPTPASTPTRAAPAAPTPAPTSAAPQAARAPQVASATDAPLSPQILAALVKAQELARQRHDALVTPEHLLLGLLSLSEPNDLATVLAEHGLTAEVLALKLLK
jgi:ATP-dependent Clp protease ATP-binding subunit ClpA